MDGLQKIEHLSGPSGEVDAKSDPYFIHKKKEMKITKTILVQNLPNQIKFGDKNPMDNSEVELQFEKLADNSLK